MFNALNSKLFSYLFTQMCIHVWGMKICALPDQNGNQLSLDKVPNFPIEQNKKRNQYEKNLFILTLTN